MGALLSFASMVPVAGWGTGGAKLGRQVLKHGDEAIGLVSKAVGKVDDVGGALGKVAGKADDVFDASTKQLKVLQKACFVPGTPVLTPSGAKAIESLRPGDLVLSRVEDDVAAPVHAQMVGALFELSARIWEVHVGGKRIEATPEHPFYVSEEGWTPANRLKPGDLLVGHTETPRRVERVVETDRTTTVYNLRVEQNHTFFVGEPSWGFSVWVHNTTCPRGGFGNIGSHGPVHPDTVFSAAEKYLGKGYKEIAPGVFESADGLRRFRIRPSDLVGAHGVIGPHVHFEALNAAREVIENLHIPMLMI